MFNESLKNRQGFTCESLKTDRFPHSAPLTTSPGFQKRAVKKTAGKAVFSEKVFLLWGIAKNYKMYWGLQVV